MMGDPIKEYQKRREKRLRDRGYRQDVEEDGKWITTENGHKVHISDGGEPDKGNPHVVDAMKGNGDISEEELKNRQLQVVLKMNPARDSYHAWIREVKDIKTFDEVADEMVGITPDVTREMVERAKKTGKIKIYSSHNIRGGTFVTPSKMLAESYSGDGRISEKVVPLNHVAWMDGEQGQYVGDVR